MWTYLFGPILSLFPKPWRALLSSAKNLNWERATAISGFCEAVLGLVALMYWYSYEMTIMTDNGAAYALSGNLGREVRPQEIGGAALFVWWMHPVTWLLAYVGLEGVFRFCAGAFSDNACGIFPLYLTDKIIFSPFRRWKRGKTDPAAGIGHVASYVGAVKERVRDAGQREVPDELCFTRTESGEFLEVRASRRKQDWTPPRVVRYEDEYYRLETDTSAGGPRPYRYQLRKLAAGVPGRTVIFYTPADAVILKTAR